MFAPSFNPAFFTNSPAGSGAGAFDPAALLQGFAESDLPSLINDIFLSLAAAASHAPAQDEPVISPGVPSSSSAATATSAKDAAPAESFSPSTVRRPRCVLSLPSHPLAHRMLTPPPSSLTADWTSPRPPPRPT